MIEKDISQYLSLEQRARNLFGENYDLENCVEELRQYRNTTLSPEQVRIFQKRFLDVSLRLRDYMEIGTTEECRSAVEKQKAKTPDFEADGSYGDYGGEIVYDTWICPGCGEHYEIDYDKHEYCPCCGQKLSWENHDVTK